MRVQYELIEKICKPKLAIGPENIILLLVLGKPHYGICDGGYPKAWHVSKMHLWWMYFTYNQQVVEDTHLQRFGGLDLDTCIKGFCDQTSYKKFDC